jgi:hypothetical protein
MNGLAVFDAFARKETLAPLRLAFLCGVYLSPGTLRAVEELVAENGLTAVCPPRFLPARLQTRANGSYTEIADSDGLWIAARDPADERVRRRVKDLLGAENEIRLPFAQGSLTLRISENGETFATT